MSPLQFNLRSLFKLIAAASVVFAACIGTFGDTIQKGAIVFIGLLVVLLLHCLAAAVVMVPVAFGRWGMRSVTEFLFGTSSRRDKP
jgi:hypothetical protein